MDLFYSEMMWQQELGRVSPYLKKFANQCVAISWGNYILVLLINFLFLIYYEYD